MQTKLAYFHHQCQYMITRTNIPCHTGTASMNHLSTYKTKLGFEMVGGIIFSEAVVTTSFKVEELLITCSEDFLEEFIIECCCFPDTSWNTVICCLRVYFFYQILRYACSSRLV